MSAAPTRTRISACVNPDLIKRADEVGKLLRQNRKTVVTAESCTAGLIAAVLSQADDAGEVLHGSFVTYSKKNKTTALGVPATLLDKKGSVNEAVAVAMAEGALIRSPADIALAVTGVLGPEPDEDGNPVGLVWLCCAQRNAKPAALKEIFAERDPDGLRHRTVTAALALLAETVRRG